MKQRWLQYHARKTEGILSLCPCCKGMPMRLTSGNSHLAREYGIHNGATCVVQGWELDPLDEKELVASKEAQVVLRALPKKLIVRMDRPLSKQYEGLPKQCFPLSPVTVYWSLDAEESIEIHRRGFPVVPNFSTTIDGATGKTMDTALVDLGSTAEVPTFTKAMKGYIALSRVRKADDVLLAQPFSPALFRLGPQPWPTLLLDTLKGNINSLEDEAKAKQRAYKQTTLLRDLSWACDTCDASNIGDYRKFITGQQKSEDWFSEYWKDIIAPGAHRRCLACRGETPTEAMLRCERCGMKPRSAFTASDIHHAANEKQATLCRDCRSPSCTNPACPTCKVCRDAECKSPGSCGKELVTLNPFTLPKTEEDRKTFLCLACLPIPCTLCGPRPRVAFIESAVRHLKVGRQVRCIDCSHPLCSAPGCTTCRRCRSETCRKPNQCKATIKPLQAKKQPGAMIEKLQFRCESCRYPPCLVCKKQMPKGSRGRFDKQDSLEWTCGDCLTLEESRKVRARDRGEELLECTSCHQSLSCASFSESRWRNRKEKSGMPQV